MKSTVKANAVFTEKCIALNTFIRKQEKVELKQLGKGKLEGGGNSIKIRN